MATGTRVRYNLSSGTLGAAITDVATTLDLGADPGWATLGAGEYVAVVVNDEIMHVTAYTAAATTCTVERGQEGTTAAAHSSGDDWRNGATVADFDVEELANFAGLPTSTVADGRLLVSDAAPLDSEGVGDDYHLRSDTLELTGPMLPNDVTSLNRAAVTSISTYNTGRRYAAAFAVLANQTMVGMRFYASSGSGDAVMHLLDEDLNIIGTTGTVTVVTGNTGFDGMLGTPVNLVAGTKYFVAITTSAANMGIGHQTPYTFPDPFDSTEPEQLHRWTGYREDYGGSVAGTSTGGNVFGIILSGVPSWTGATLVELAGATVADGRLLVTEADPLVGDGAIGDFHLRGDTLELTGPKEASLLQATAGAAGNAVHSSSKPRYAIRFQVTEAKTLSTVTLLHWDGATTIDVAVLDSSKVVIETITVSGVTSGAATDGVPFTATFTTPVDLDADTDYYIGIKAATAFQLENLATSTGADADAPLNFVGIGNLFYRWNAAGADWTATHTDTFAPAYTYIDFGFAGGSSWTGSTLVELAKSLMEAIDETTTSRTLALTDAGKVIESSNAAATTITVPPNSSVAFPIGTVIGVYSGGAGGVVLAEGSGVTVRNLANLTQYGETSLRKRATDEWVQA